MPTRTLPVLIHGDAAFPGQGIVAETLNLSRLDGYTTGGTIHIIANNQLGFTADAARVLLDLVRQRPGARLQDPDRSRQRRRPDRVHRGGARWRAAYRARFQRDFLIDLVGYRRYGHNEGDEPLHAAADVPEDRQRTRPCASIWAAHARAATRDGQPASRDAMVERHMTALEQALRARSSRKQRLRRADPGAAAAWRRAAGEDRGAARTAASARTRRC